METNCTPALLDFIVPKIGRFNSSLFAPLGSGKLAMERKK